MTQSPTHLILIPSYNSGSRLLSTVQDALSHWSPVWVVVDGSTDGSHHAVEELARTESGLRVVVRASNGGKGAAVLTGAELAQSEGFTHALVMDSDGQHPCESIGLFMEKSLAAPSALILGRPLFGPEAPNLRLQGRKLSVAMAYLEILGPGIDDPLFGFRVYPIRETVHILRHSFGARRYDFDLEIAVKLFWFGTPTLNIPARCRYLSGAEGGVSHFHYLRDNLRMVWLHTRLIFSLIVWRWIFALRARFATGKQP